MDTLCYRPLVKLFVWIFGVIYLLARNVYALSHVLFALRLFLLLWCLGIELIVLSVLALVAQRKRNGFISKGAIVSLSLDCYDFVVIRFIFESLWARAFYIDYRRFLLVQNSWNFGTQERITFLLCSGLELHLHPDAKLEINFGFTLFCMCVYNLV